MADPADAAAFTQNFTSAANNARALSRLQQMYMGQQMEQGRAQEQRAVAQEQRNEQAFTREQTEAEARRLHGIFNDFLGPWAQGALQAGDDAAQRKYVADSLRNPAFRQRLQAADLYDNIDDIDPNDPDLIGELKMLAGAVQQRAGDSRDNLGNANVGDFTPESYQAWLESGSTPQTRNYKLLQRVWAPQVATIAEVPSLVGRGSGGPTVKPLTDIKTVAENAGAVAGAEAGSEADAKGAADARNSLPKVEQQAEDVIRTVTNLKNHPGLQYITGKYSMAPIVPGSSQAGADALALQIEGQTFLQAFESLKGAGQITEVEGAQAKAAIARLSRKQSMDDYTDALDELVMIANRAKRRAQQRAQGGQAAGGSGGWSIEVVQ
jgi:hypothetical protein